MTTLIRNKKKQSVILPLRGQEPLIFMPAGDPTRSDVLMVEDAVVESVGLKEAIRRGLLEIVPESEVDAVLTHQDVAMDVQQSTAPLDATIERRQNRDLIAATCIGPGARPGMECGATLIRPSAEVKNGDAPPLCSSHESLSATYYQTEVQVEGRSEDGVESGPVTTKVWKRMEMAPPRRNLT